LISGNRFDAWSRPEARAIPLPIAILRQNAAQV